MIDHFGAPWVAPDAYRLRDDARRFETWENNYAARLGLGVAVDYALALGLEAIEARCRALADLLRDGLRRHPGRRRCTTSGHGPAAIVSFSIAGPIAEAVKARCAAAGVNVSTSEPCEHAARRDGAVPADGRSGLAALLQQRGGDRAALDVLRPQRPELASGGGDRPHERRELALVELAPRAQARCTGRRRTGGRCGSPRRHWPG